MTSGRTTALSVWAGLGTTLMVIMTLAVLANPEASPAMAVVGVLGAGLYILTYMRQDVGPIGLTFLYVGSGWYQVGNSQNPASVLGSILGVGLGLILLWGLWFRDVSHRNEADRKATTENTRREEEAKRARENRKKVERMAAEAVAKKREALIHKAEKTDRIQQLEHELEEAREEVRKAKQEAEEAKKGRRPPPSNALVP